MRFTITVLLGLLLATLMARAGEKLPVLKVGSDVYTNVTVTSVTATDLIFTSDNGMGNAKLKNLDPELQKHFHYDAAKMAAVDQKQKTAQAAASAPINTPFDPADINTNNAQTIMDEAIRRVKAIVNQPVRRFARTEAMEHVWVSSPGWLHPGAATPDFDHVDIRATQDLHYLNSQYATSDLNPGVVWLGAEIEFNSMTKYFYEDRTVPRKRLTEPEMLEINRLYRIIGKCRAALAPPMGNPAADVEVVETEPAAKPPVLSRDYFSMHKRELVVYGSVALGVLLAIKVLLALRKKA